MVCINCWTKEVVENIGDYAGQNFPMMLVNGDKVYIDIPKEVDSEWSFQLVDASGNEYNDENEAYVNLIEFIIANNIINTVYKNINGENHPVYICDVFDKFSEEQTKTVMSLIKDMNKQVFIILREPNELVSSCSDKTVEYYFNHDNKMEEEYPF